jgi:hypothetical protein
VAQLPDGGVEGHRHRCIWLVLQQGAEFDPWIPGGVATRPGSGRELPCIPLSEREEPAEANQAIHQVLLGQLGSGAGGDLLQEGAGHHGGLAKLQLLDHSS